MTSANEQHEGAAIAVIGMAGRFPGAENLAQYWENLRAGVESIRRLDESALAGQALDPALLREGQFVPAVAALDRVEYFDASFFGYSPREAELIDPQQRIFLECAWAALEHAGYAPSSFPGAIGVYAGASLNTYLLANLVSHPDFVEALAQHQVNSQMQISVGSAGDFLTTRVSYKLNLRGPSHLIQSACSTSLLAVHVACQALLDDECDLALAGGVAINLNQASGYLYQADGIASPDGHCRAFDAAAQGTVLGSGVGVVVLKRLPDALADRDSIHAVIRGSAANNDGAAKVGFTAPSVQGQAKVIAEALANAGVPPATIGYVEAHGTATPLGDPIEVAALTQAFRARTQRSGFCALGSVKTNVGHLDIAAGVAGFMKTALALKHGQIPPSLHFREPNPRIDFTNSPFYVNTELREWPAADHPRRAGVSSFGIGGTNVHMILEEPPAPPPTDPARPWQLLLLSAKTPGALEAATANLAAHLREEQACELADIAYTLQIGRTHFAHRRALVCRDRADAIAALETLDPRRALTLHQKAQDRPVVFMFPGGGAQYTGMGRELYATEPVFREHVDHCAALLEPHLGLDIRAVIYPTNDERRTTNDESSWTIDNRQSTNDEGSSTIDEGRRTNDEGSDSSFVVRPSSDQALTGTGLALPALFTVEYALARLWMSWGLMPQAMIGHSLGEYVAACLSGVFALEDALALVALRGRLFEQLPEGAMLNVPLAPEAIAPLLDERLALAAVNGPAQCVVAGPSAAVEELAARLAARDIAARRVAIAVAAHSPQVEPILERFGGFVAGLRLRAPAIPFISNVSGTWITAEEAADPGYWTRHLRQTVRFADGLRELLKEPGRVLLEVGPGHTLSTLAGLQEPPAQAALPSMRHPRDRQPDVAFLLNTLGQLWLAGVAIDWAGLYAHKRRRRVPLPTYPFERERYWVEPRRPSEAPPRAASGKKPAIADWFYLPSWRRSMPPRPFQPAGEPRRWLVLGDDCGVGQMLRERLERAGQPVAIALAGERFERLGERSYTLNPRQADSYDALLDELALAGGAPQIILHCWSVSQDEPACAGPEFFKACQERGYYSLLFLAQALIRRKLREELRIVVVSNDAHAVNGEEVFVPEKAPILGACKVIPLEQLQIGCQSIDIALPRAGGAAAPWLIDQILAEAALPAPDPVVAYRGRERLVQSFEPVRLPPETAPIRSLREGGVYLITGGLGRVGALLADYLARTARARLALLGRSALPERAAWERWLATHDQHDPASRAIRRILALEAHGAEVLPLSADVADEQQMRAALRRIDERFGALHGVLHAAGITTGPSTLRPIPLIGRDESEQQIQPKDYGLYVLERLLRGRDLDFCMLFSSNAAVLGGLGFVAYAAANSFVDAFAARQHRAGPVHWMSTNWDIWLTPEETQHESGATSMDAYAMAPDESAEAFRRVVTQATVGQVVVSAGDLPARLQTWLKREFAAQAEPDQPAGALHHRPKLQHAYVPPSSPLEQQIARIWQQALGIEQVGIDDSFFELGGNSLIAIQVLTRFKKELQIDVSVTDLYEGLTIRSMVALANPAPEPPQDEPGGESPEEREQRARWRKQFLQQRQARRKPE